MKEPSPERHTANMSLQFWFTLVGALATAYVCRLDINPIVASAIVAISLALMAVVVDDRHRLSWGAFCGTFAGMTSAPLLTWERACPALSLDFLTRALVLSAITGASYAVVELLTPRFPRGFFRGYGGRLGAIAFLSVLLHVAIGERFEPSFQSPVVASLPAPLVAAPLKLLAAPFALAGALISKEVKSTVSRSNINYGVVTTAITGIIGGILVVKIPVHGYLLAQAWYAGAFVGMTSFDEVMPQRDFAFAGALSGVLLVAAEGAFAGVGGKLGLVAFAAVTASRAVRKLARSASRLHDLFGADGRRVREADPWEM